MGFIDEGGFVVASNGCCVSGEVEAAEDGGADLLDEGE